LLAINYFEGENMSLPLLSKIGSFYVGGRTVKISGTPIYERQFVLGGPVRKVDPNGDFESGQMYVQYFLQENPISPYPLLLVHGGGMCGSCWENSLVESEGWLQYFLRQHYDVYVADAVERGRSGWSQFPDIYKSAPIFRSKNEAWLGFRIGSHYDSNPQKRVAFPETQFPIDMFDYFMKMNVPRWTTNNAETLAAYETCLKKIGPSILILHSQGSEFGMQLIRKYPELIRAAVFLEPSSTPYKEACASDVPILYVWGDNITGTHWETYESNVRDYYEKQLAIDNKVTWLSLPKYGIRGNSHFLMLDKNNKEILALIIDWLQKALK